uniref:Uncharacterized protein n=1 Tax=Knipowitschia caucasica TaxID=637954 RepID=A0AAV2J9W4_KNICA
MTETFIRVRAENDVLFTGAKFSASTAWRTILEKLDPQEVVTPLQEVVTPLQEVVTPLQEVVTPCRRWRVTPLQEVVTPLQEVVTPLQEVVTPLQEVVTPLQEVVTPLQEVVTPLQARQGVEGNPTAGTWPRFGLMDEVSGQKPSINPPVLIASIPDARPGPSQAREQEPEQEEEEPESEQQRGTGRKRKRESELVKLYREDLRMQREEDERRAQERSANFDRLFGLLEKLIENKNK